MVATEKDEEKLEAVVLENYKQAFRSLCSKAEELNLEYEASFFCTLHCAPFYQITFSRFPME